MNEYIKHGRWSECYTDAHHYSGICSVCGKASIKSLTESLYAFCPKCGAKMDGDKQFGKYNPPILYRCMSCGAAIRKYDKYHELHIKGQKYIFCKLCVELSDHIAYEREWK